MTPEQKTKLEKDLLYFVRTVCKPDEPRTISLEEIRILPEIVDALIRLDATPPVTKNIHVSVQENGDITIGSDGHLRFQAGGGFAESLCHQRPCESRG